MVGSRALGFAPAAQWLHRQAIRAHKYRWRTARSSDGDSRPEYALGPTAVLRSLRRGARFLRGLVLLTVHSYLDPPLQPICWFCIAHGVIFSIWVGPALARVALVATGRSAAHRRLGRVDFVLAPCIAS